MRRGRVAREERREAATKLREARAQRSHQEQLDILDAKLGKGVGAKKERSRLARLIEEALSPTKQRGKNVKPRTRSDRRKAKAKRYAEKESAVAGSEE